MLDLSGQIALVHRIQNDLLRDADHLNLNGKPGLAEDCREQAMCLNEVVTSLEHLQNIRKASATLIAEARDALAGLPISPDIQDNHKQVVRDRSNHGRRRT